METEAEVALKGEVRKMNKCGMCGFFGECTHRKENDSAENCNQYHDNVYMKYNHPDEWDELVKRCNGGEQE